MTDRGKTWIALSAHSGGVSFEERVKEAEFWLRLGFAKIITDADALCKKYRDECLDHEVSTPPCDHCIAESMEKFKHKMLGAE